MELYARVRRAVQVEGKSEREVAREYGLARETVRKMMRYSAPPGYRRQQPAKRPKLGPWVGVIGQILQEDRERPRKQRHAAKRIYQRLRDDEDTIWNDVAASGKGFIEFLDQAIQAKLRR